MWKELCELAYQIRGLPRHVSQHVGGMIISSRPLVEIVPLERAAMEDRVVCQWDKDSCDDARFIKIDFLALGMLSLVEECVELIARRTGSPPDLSRIDFDDVAIYDRICAGDTIGLFQIESRAQIQMIRRSRPRNLEDLAVGELQIVMAVERGGVTDELGGDPALIERTDDGPHDLAGLVDGAARLVDGLPGQIAARLEHNDDVDCDDEDDAQP